MVTATGRNEQCDARCVDGCQTFYLPWGRPPMGTSAFLPTHWQWSAVCWAKFLVFAISHSIYVMTDILRRPT
jgi:hypothetical protein